VKESTIEAAAADSLDGIRADGFCNLIIAGERDLLEREQLLRARAG
jgi:hypothetical protein